LHICAPINQRSFDFPEIAFLEFEIYKIVPRLQPLLIHRAPVFGVEVIVCTFFALQEQKGRAGKKLKRAKSLSDQKARVGLRRQMRSAGRESQPCLNK
jgi:hypothetical protein